MATALLVVTSFVTVLLAPLMAWGACRELPPSPEAAPAFFLHLSGDCTAAEREARAVSSEVLLRALQAGRSLDLDGVVIQGELLLDRLPVHMVSKIERLPDQARAWLSERAIAEGRVIEGAIKIQRSHVRGRIATRIRQGEGVVIIRGAVVMTGTVFEAPQDWSHVVFAGPLEWPDAVFQQEGMFVRGLFLDQVRFEGTQFGPHTRFHRSQFHAPVSFDRAVFHGLSELLEVTFWKPASFQGVRFGQGTGFSGANFEGPALFTDSVFGREAYFLFAQFRQAAGFEQVRFEGTASFANARFQGLADFREATFRQPPNWTNTEFLAERVLPGTPWAERDWANLAVTLGAGLAAAVLLWVVFWYRPRS